MAFTLPNAISYGDTIAALEQAEPDSLDFKILGDGRSHVLSGGNVTATAQNPSQYIDITLAASEVVIEGVYGSIATGTVTTGAAPSSGSRFDIVCAYNSGTAFSYEVVAGTSSVTNPVFPAIAAGYLPLYAVFVRSDLKTGTLSRVIVDKRRFESPAVVRTGSSTPTGGLSGDLYLKTGSIASGQSNLWVNNAGTWQNLAGYVQPIATANTASTIVARDASGNFSAGTITASLNGNASTVTNGVYNDGGSYGISITGSAAKWTNSRTLSFTGDVTGSITVDGSSNQSATLTLNPSVPTAKSIAIGTTTTGSAGTSATVSVSQTESTATLSFTIPQGIQGIPGINGTNGTNGTNGADGAQGPAGPTLAANNTPIGSTNTVLWLRGNNLDTIQVDSITARIWGACVPYQTNAYSLGGSGAKWTTVYATNGTINTSDARLKTDIAESPLGLGFINSLRPVQYRWIDGGPILNENPTSNEEKVLGRKPGQRLHFGFIAQEVKQAIDTLAVEDFGGWVQDDLNDPESTQSLNYGEFISPIVKAIQELSARVEALEAK